MSQATDIVKLAEHLKILVPYGAQVLASLGNIRHAATMPSNKSGAPPLAAPPSLRLFREPALLTVAKAFTKKFPETEAMNKQSKEYKEFVEAFKEIKEELRPIYLVFSAWADFLDTNPDLAQNVVFLAHYLVATLQLVAKIGKGKKAIASAVIVLDARTGVVLDSSFSKIAELFVALDKPYSFIPEVFAPISARLTQLLGGLKIEMSSGPLAPVETLRKSGLFGLVGMACADPTAPTPDDIRLRLITHMSLYSQSIVTIMFACAADVVNDSNAITLLKMAISNGTYSGTTGDDVIQAAQEFEALIKSNAKLSKLKSQVTEAVGKYKQMSIKFHRERREYLAHQMTQILLLCRDNPGLLGPKFPLILGCLNFARDEIMHYFTHLDDNKPAPGSKSSGGSSGSKNAPAPRMGLDVLHLLHLTLAIKGLVLSNRDLVMRYQCNLVGQSFSGSVLSALSTLISQEALPDGVRQLALAVKALYEQADLDHLDHYRAFRMNWARLQVYLSLPECMVPITSLPQVTRTLNEVAAATTLIDDLPKLVAMVSDMQQLARHHDTLLAHITEAMTASAGAPSMAILDLIGPLANELAAGNQPDRAAEFAIAAIERLAAVTVDVVLRHAHLKAKLERKAKWDGMVMKGGKGVPGEVFTGEESLLSSGNVTCRHLDALGTQSSDMLAAFATMPSISNAHFTLHPQTQLQQALSREVHAYLQSSVFDAEANAAPAIGDDMPYAIHTPAMIQVAAEAVFADLYEQLAVIPGFPTAAMLDTVLQQQNHPGQVAEFSEPLPEQLLVRPPASPTKRKPGPPRTPPAHLPYAVAVGHYYADLLTARTWTSGLVYSAARQALVHAPAAGPHHAHHKSSSTASSGAGGNAKDGLHAWRADIYTDPPQLSALARVVGPPGMRLIDARMIPYITAIGTGLINQVNGVLGTLASAGPPANLAANVAKLRAAAGDDPLERLAALGYILEARHVVHRAARGSFVVHDAPTNRTLDSACRAAAAVAAGGQAEENKPAGMFEYAEWLSHDEFSDAPLDQAFDFIKHLNVTPVGIPTLVSFLATALCAAAFSDSGAYNAAIEASHNNAHCIATAVHAVLLLGLPKLSAVASKQDVMGVAESVFAMASGWMLQLHRVHMAAATGGDGAAAAKSLKLRDVDSAWMVVHRLAKLFGATGERWAEHYIGLGLVKSVHAAVVRKTVQYRRRRVGGGGSRGHLVDDDAE
ncbi:hypothetical protein H9P43_000850 [Blastocladiella emersonii ATCC 22665]|nr:hypothetical protein H9P43_000850 [Blastocladiella emersonii ATCC 22665]